MADLLIRTDPRYSRYLDRAQAARADALRALFRAVVNGLARALRARRRARTRGRWIAALNALDDRTLRDIGVHRGNIRSAVFEAERRCAAAERRARLRTIEGRTDSADGIAAAADGTAPVRHRDRPAAAE